MAGCFFPFDMAHLLSPRTAPAPHHRESAGGRVYTRQLEAALHELPIVKEFKAKDGWYSTRPYTKLEPQKAQHSLTGGALRGPGMLAVPPMVFAREDESEAVVVVHLGRSMCGHDGIVHGGMVGVVLDEATGRNVSGRQLHSLLLACQLTISGPHLCEPCRLCSTFQPTSVSPVRQNPCTGEATAVLPEWLMSDLHRPSGPRSPANLNINYRLPTRADQWVVIRTKLVERKGRKVIVGAEMATLDGEILADAKCVFPQPACALFHSRSRVGVADRQLTSL